VADGVGVRVAIPQPGELGAVLAIEPRQLSQIVEARTAAAKPLALVEQLLEAGEGLLLRVRVSMVRVSMVRIGCGVHESFPDGWGMSLQLSERRRQPDDRLMKARA